MDQLQINLLTNPIGTFFGTLFEHTFSKVGSILADTFKLTFRNMIQSIPNAIFGSIASKIGVQLASDAIHSSFGLFDNIHISWSLPKLDLSSRISSFVVGTSQTFVNNITSNITDGIDDQVESGFSFLIPDIFGMLSNLFSSLKEALGNIAVIAAILISLVVVAYYARRKRNSEVPGPQERNVGSNNRNVDVNDPGTGSR